MKLKENNKIKYPQTTLYLLCFSENGRQIFLSSAIAQLKSINIQIRGEKTLHYSNTINIIETSLNAQSER